MGRLEELRINAYLSEVARGYRNNAFVADVLFPTIYSEKEKIDIFLKNYCIKYLIMLLCKSSDAYGPLAQLVRASGS